ncbi:GntR family transcriptional regulator [Catelliglobosispora koreensis]|uniref:GntR family transcriptional regulator n=1 Tax=Catelliglobosispora koreensis TaxID=129052 RepID=UPI0003798901|nr:GntR family transcriptional regulator [Catelliglobosispora koreensis]
MQSDPLWIQTASRIRAQIAQDGLPPGAKLPPERDLCERLGVSRLTLRRALAELAERGHIKPSHGRGWFVAVPVSSRDWPEELESFTATARRKNLVASAIVLMREVRPASLDEAERLQLPAGSPLFRLDRVRLLGDVRVAVDRTTLPALPGLEDVDFREASLFALVKELGIALGRSEATIEARAASAELSAHLGLSAGAPVLFLDQTIYTLDQRPAMLSTVEYSGERYRLRTTFRA